MKPAADHPVVDPLAAGLPIAGVPAEGVQVAAPRRANFLARLVAGALPFALPSACAGCGVSGARVICAGCAACLEDRDVRCACCALPLAALESSHVLENAAAAGLPDFATAEIPAGFRASAAPVQEQARIAGMNPLCGRCITDPPAFDAALCVADYAAPADDFVLALKFHRRLALAGCLASMLARRTLSSGIQLPDLIAPVPLSSRRLATRGYNQAWEIARPFARRLRRPAAARVLIRSRDTQAQAELPAAERRLNIRGAFEVSPAAAVRARHIGLVDDVMTSGATLDAAARALKEAGAARVTAFVILRTPRP
jgi:ComF family protein